ncbi:type III secretion system co-regulatory protein PtrC [Pseudomonas subflava]|uniref:type III secretion system co-regulatory protein PtrC n=1 Tax=Pseudomonas subflava TaxID=2952933 RepID=UPI00207A6E26|nr:type III secretion system co-regulatory protein PtrC [Pseudomonas subflava]
MTITEAFSSSNTYGITYVSLTDSGLHFESEAAVHMDDGSLLTLRMPTRQNEKMSIHSVVCMQNGWCQAA